MLYLIVHCEAQGSDRLFADALTDQGRAKADHLGMVLDSLGVQTLFTAPHRRALDTLKPYIDLRRSQGNFLRTEAHYELCDGVFLPERKPESLALEEIQVYGLNRQSLYGNIPDPEDLDTYRARVLSWYTDHFWSEYRDCPYPTAIVADAMTIGVLVYYIMLTKGGGNDTAKARNVVENLKPGTVLECGIDDMQLRLRRRVI